MESRPAGNRAAIGPPAAVRRVQVVYNPVAGWRRHRRIAAVIAALRARGIEVLARATTRRGDAEALAREATRVTCDRLVVGGGDGTINEALNGLADPALPFAIVPLGTANVLAAEIGLSANPDTVATAIAGGPARPACLGTVNGRRFVMCAGIGFDARTVARVNLRLKRWTGKLAYFAAGLAEFAAYRPVEYRVTVDGREYRAASAIVANGRSYAGRFVFAPKADLAAPTLEVCLLKRPGRLNLLRYAVAIIVGQLHRLRDVVIVTGRDILVEGPVGDPVQVDGDIVSQLPARIGVIPDAVLLVRPAP